MYKEVQAATVGLGMLFNGWVWARAVQANSVVWVTMAPADAPDAESGLKAAIISREVHWDSVYRPCQRQGL